MNEIIDKPTTLFIVNLGTPDSPQVTDVRKYLREFLMDKFVIDIPWILRWILVNLIIVPFRSPKSAHAYLKIWQNDGSPLLVNSKKLAQKLQYSLGKKVNVMLAMRYGSPGIESEWKNIETENIVILPLYPQYAESTVKTVVEEIDRLKNKNQKIKFIEPFYNNPKFIKSISEKTLKTVNLKNIDHLIFSYHGLPERHVLKTDSTNSYCLKSQECCKKICNENKNCYSHHCYETTRLVVQELKLPDDKFSTCFQSRLGRDKWLSPSTEETVTRLLAQGKTKLAIVAPSFMTDCLETLEEINIQLREKFFESGGVEFFYIPCLNDDESWIMALSDIVEKNLEICKI